MTTPFKTNKLFFKRIFARNFRSIDNMGMEVVFTAGGTTVIGSLDNGAGKSTLFVHALYYVLFDKAYGKGCTKTGLINSRSNKDCYVEVEFDANGSSWKVARGQKPTLFEIWKDDVKIEDEAALSDYQKNLSKVIGMDEKVFCNTVALGRDKFVPFVDMSTPDRRNYGEQMLDATVFTQMNELNKARIKATQTSQLEINSKLNNLKFQVQGLESVIEVKKQAALRTLGDLEQRRDQKISEGKSHASKLSEAQAEVSRINAEIEALKPIQEARTTFAAAVEKVRSNLKDKINERDRAKVQKTHCHACAQPLPLENRTALIESLDAAIEKVQAGLDVAEVKLRGMKDVSQELWALDAKGRQASNEAGIAQAQLRSATQEAQQIQTKINEIVNAAKPDWSSEESQLKLLEEEEAALRVRLTELDKEMVHHKIIEAGLKDDGAKSQIIKEYLPFINSRINWYLEHMNMFLTVELDAEFELQMLAPDRKGQTLANLSTGQKARIDLSTLLAWRDVAAQSASCDTNILILDEVLENMSEAGVTDFLEMWHHSDGSATTSLFVITQRLSEFRQQFDRSIVYDLKDGFTHLVESD